MCSRRCTLPRFSEMLSPSLATVRLFLHVIAASVWVGGQVVMAGLVPTARRTAPDAVQALARAFARVAWPAFVVVVLTGVWNLMAVDVINASGDYVGTLMVKILIAVLSGVFAVVHQGGRSKAALAVGGALGALTSIAAMFLGVLLHAHG